MNLSLSPLRAAMTAPPVPPETYLAELTKMREQIAAIRSATTAEQAIQLGIQEQETTSKLAERLIMSVSAVENRVAALEGTAIRAMTTMQATVQAAAAHSTPIERKRKSLAESKCIGNMRTLGSDKAEFRMWNEKFINAIAQVLGTPWRVYIRNLNRKLDQIRTVLTDDELVQIEGAQEIKETGNCDEGI